MGKLLSFQAAAAKREEDQQVETFRQHITGILSEMSQSERLELLDAVERGDEEKYFALTNPIIARRVIREYNK